MKFHVVRYNCTGNEYLVPMNREYLAVMRVEDGEPVHTNFSMYDIRESIKFGAAKVVGTATITINVEYSKC